ncbi:MAG: hypothetical protein AAFY82_05475 [Pseudomonadota bacterium]
MTPIRGKSSLHKQADRTESSVETDETVDADAAERLEALKQALQEKYEDIKNERVPDRLQRLIDALREAEHLAGAQDED